MTTRTNPSKHQWRKSVIGPLLTITVWLLLLHNLDTTPPPWWDEGWTLTVARTWVERGHYGMLQLGEPAPPGLNAAWPVTASFALGFKLLGVGVWQARFVGILYTVGALSMLGELVRRLYGRRIAYIALFLAIWCAPALRLMPTYVGREVMAEMPMLFYLLGGYVFYDKTHHDLKWIGPTMVLWALGLLCKAQPLPFLLISLILPPFLALKAERLKWMTHNMAILFGVLIIKWGLEQVWLWLIAPSTLPSEPVQDLTRVVGMTLGVVPRLHNALTYIGFLGWGIVPGILYEGYSFLSARRFHSYWNSTRLSVYIFCIFYLGWYILLSAGWLRYLFPIYFCSHGFTASLLDRASHHIQFKSTVQRGTGFFIRPSWQGLGALWALIVISSYIVITIIIQGGTIRHKETFLYQTADFINALPETARIETYESELFFLINRPYHYPPDQFHAALIRRKFEDIPLAVIYNPLLYAPDYLIIGEFSRDWGTYDTEMLTKNFILIKTFGPYQVYQRKL